MAPLGFDDLDTITRGIKMTIRLVLSIFMVLFGSSAAFAETPFQFTAAGLQAPSDPDVKGMRMVLLYGKNTNVNGLDLGFAAISEAVNQKGFSFNMGLTQVTGTSTGCASSLINVHSGEDSGFNAAFINFVKNIEEGVNVGFLNVTDDFSNVDVGGLSVSDQSNVQVGFVNVTKKINRVQIGFLNFAENGFFPVFPIFNFPKK
jgi:hypothetical protein